MRYLSVLLVVVVILAAVSAQGNNGNGDCQNMQSYYNCHDHPEDWFTNFICTICCFQHGKPGGSCENNHCACNHHNSGGPM